MAQNFKDIRAKGVAVLSEISAELGKIATAESAADAKKPFVAASKELQIDDVSILADLCNVITDESALIAQRRIHRVSRSKACRRAEGYIQRCL